MRITNSIYYDVQLRRVFQVGYKFKLDGFTLSPELRISVGTKRTKNIISFIKRKV